MKAIYIQKGETLDYTPTDDVAAGSVVPLTSRIGIAAAPIPAGKTGALQMEGVFLLPKLETETFQMGDLLYYDKDADVITATASKEEGEGAGKTTTANTPAGFAAAPATGKSVLVKLLG